MDLLQTAELTINDLIEQARLRGDAASLKPLIEVATVLGDHLTHCLGCRYAAPGCERACRRGSFQSQPMPE